MKIVNVTISPWDFDIEVTAEIDSGEPRTWDDPGYEAYAEINSARVGGVDVYAMLNATQVERMEHYVLRAFDLV
jgi:alpha-L-fucosidase